MHRRPILPWIAAGVAAAAALAWAFPRAYPLFPRDWQISAREAEGIALERLRDLGELPAERYVVTQLDGQLLLERRLRPLLGRVDPQRARASLLARDLLAWEVTVYPAGARPEEWSHRARVGASGLVSALRLRMPAEQPGGAIDPRTARRRADAFLREQEFDLGRFAEPEQRRRQLQARTDLSLRYRDREALLGTGVPYGLEVSFAGERLAGYALYLDDPDRAALQTGFRPITLLSQTWVIVAVLLVPLVAVPFLRRYHAGEIGVRRGLEIALIILVCGVATLLLCAKAASAGWSMGVLSRQQVTWVVVFQMVALYFFPSALVAFLSWSVGESLCRERWSGKLAAFDALFKGDWQNATFAHATLRGTVSGLLVLAGLWLLAAALGERGGGAFTNFLLQPWWGSAGWFAVPLVTFGLSQALYTGLFGRLLLVPAGVRLAGRWLGPVLAVVVAAALFFPLVIVYPLGWNLLFWLLAPAVFVFLFLRYGIYTSILASWTAFVARGAVPFLGADDPSIQLQASLALLVVAVPLVVSFRHLASDREFEYRYEDVPPHVRRIAERERQKVELETARGIQTSILPDLPAQLNGVRLAHAYLPATEVGGDFYDVLALEDGRLAVAVGDVAGHGVSSGLVMSMAKSALAVQVTFDPEVEPVFTTLNRLVFQSARRRLLATLCYALLDPERRELTYASAGHLFPYRLTPAGDVQPLESISYPLGVRPEIRVRVRAARLEPGDCLFLFSDGVVEARAPGSDELFGFERLEASLARHAPAGVDALRRGVLDDLERFTGPGPRGDDLTLLVLQLP